MYHLLFRGIFRPFQTMTRQELAVMVDQIINVPSTQRRQIFLTDMAEVATYVIKAVEWGGIAQFWY